MNSLILSIFVLLFPAISLAEVSKVNIPEIGGTVAFDSPPLSKKEETRTGDKYEFSAASGRFSLSIRVEPPRKNGSTHRAPFDFYWPKIGRRPSVAKETVKVTDHPKYVRVQYDVVGEFGGREFRQKNVNYYASFGGKWIDIQVSIIRPIPDDERILAAFDRSLTYGP